MTTLLLTFIGSSFGALNGAVLAFYFVRFIELRRANKQMSEITKQLSKQMTAIVKSAELDNPKVQA